MSSISPFLVKRPNSNNLHPITIRIIKDRKPSYLYIGQSIRLNEWDVKNRRVKNSHPNYMEINQLIIDRLSKSNKSLITAELNSEYTSAKSIKRTIVSKDLNEFFAISKLYLKKIENRKKFHQLDIEKFRINLFKIFSKREKIYFNEITVQMLEDFENYLLNERGVVKRTVANYMITIRTIFNLAISGHKVENSFYPFGKGKYQIVFPETKKIGLTSSEISELEKLEGLSAAQNYALKAWLLSFYFAGIRFSDLVQLKWEDFSDDRLYYRMNKNSKLLCLKVPVKASKILIELKEETNSKFVFHNLEDINLKDKKRLRTRIKTVNRNFNRRLEFVAEKAGINKKITMHIARHSFGNISGDKIPIHLLQKLYRHSSITTTILYQSNFIQNDMDEALDKVVNF